MKSNAGLMPAPSPGRISMLRTPRASMAAITKNTAAMTPPTIRAILSLASPGACLTSPPSLLESTRFAPAFATAMRLELLGQLIHEEDEGELRERDHPEDDPPQDVQHERPA